MNSSRPAPSAAAAAPAPAVGISLEMLLTHPRGFGLTTASPLQRAVCRIAEGRPLGRLADLPEVIRAVGGPDALAALPRVRPTEIFVISAIRCGKSLISAAIALHLALTIDLGRLSPLEVARVSVVSLDRDKAKIVRDFLLAALRGPLGRCLLSETADRVLIRRDDGRRVEIVVAAGSAAGRSLVSRWTIGCVVDEAARMAGQADGIINFDDMRKAVIARLRLIGGQLVVVTSPWAARGPVYEAVRDYWGRPSAARVIVRAPGPDMCPFNWTPEACERERLDPSGAYETDVLGEFVDPEGGWLTATEVRGATRSASMPERGREMGVEYFAGMDPATSGNAWTLVVVGRKPGAGGTRDEYSIVCARQWQGTAGAPLKAREIFGEIAPLLKEYGINEVASDRWSGSLMAEIGETGGVNVTVSRDTAQETSQNHANFRTLLLDGRLELAPHPVLLADLLSKRKRLLPGGGVSYPAPVTRDGRHADFADAAVLSVARAEAGAGGWVEAMQALERSGGVI